MKMTCRTTRTVVIPAALALSAFLSGCLAQQADLKQTERALQQRIKQSNDDLAQARARQSQDLASLREQELPQLRGELEKAQHQAQELQAKQEDLKHRSAQLEQQTKKLEQLAMKLDTDSTTRYTWVQKSLDTQDAKVGARLDELSKSMEALKKEIVEAIQAVQRTNEGLARRVDLKFEDQQKGMEKGLAENQVRLDQVTQKFAQFNQALTGFKEALTGLHDRLSQEEQTTKTLSARVEADAKDVTAHANDVTKSVTSVAKTLESVSQKVMSRLDEQDRRIESLAKAVETGGHKPGPRQPSARKTQHPAPVPQGDRVSLDAQSPEAESDQASGGAVREGLAGATAADQPQTSELSEKAEYERVLATFKSGDLEGARRGFAAFLSTFPQSDLAPNARFWLGESYYNKKDFRKAIETYEQVRTDYPNSEKAPAAMLKKGYAYLAMNDRKQASSAFKQVVTLYPRSPEAGKASDKLTQLKEAR
jgi:tol-pal system protein YbgF